MYDVSLFLFTITVLVSKALLFTYILLFLNNKSKVLFLYFKKRHNNQMKRYCFFFFIDYTLNFDFTLRTTPSMLIKSFIHLHAFYILVFSIVFVPYVNSESAA